MSEKRIRGWAQLAGKDQLFNSALACSQRIRPEEPSQGRMQVAPMEDGQRGWNGAGAGKRVRTVRGRNGYRGHGPGTTRANLQL